DQRLGRFLSVDPLTQDFPFYSPYQFASNSPILAVDLEGLESSNIKNNTETKKPAATNSAGEPITAVTPRGSNMIDTYTGNNPGFGPWTNPLNALGEDDFSYDPDNESDNNAKDHDRVEMTTTNESFKADAKFIVNQAKVALKAAENALINPVININPVVKVRPNMDRFTKKPISVTTGAKATFTPVEIGSIAVGKALMRVATEETTAFKSTTTLLYESASRTMNDIKYKTMQGISALENYNWGF
ncbi:MAG TPA: hypothetical protein VGD31_15890, partial [Sphingobacteriaceae bacterium]